MAHFAYTRPAGIWNQLTDLLSGELQDLDIKTYKAVNGDQGGTWAPSSPIVIGGTGFTSSGPTSFPSGFGCAGNASFLANVGIFGTLSSNGATNLYGATTAFGSVSVAGAGGLSVTNDVSIGDSLSVSGVSNLNGNVNSFGYGTFGTGISTGGNASVSGNATVGGTLDAGPTDIAGHLSVSSGADIGGTLSVSGNFSSDNVDTGNCVMAPCPRTFTMPNTNTTVDPTIYGSVCSTTIAGTRVIRIDDGGLAPVGTECEFVNLVPGWTLVVEDPLGNTIEELRNFTGLPYNVKAKKIAGGTWVKWAGCVVP